MQRLYVLLSAIVIYNAVESDKLDSRWLLPNNTWMDINCLLGKVFKSVVIYQALFRSYAMLV